MEPVHGLLPTSILRTTLEKNEAARLTPTCTGRLTNGDLLAGIAQAKARVRRLRMSTALPDRPALPTGLYYRDVAQTERFLRRASAGVAYSPSPSRRRRCEGMSKPSMICSERAQKKEDYSASRFGRNIHGNY